MKTGKIVFEVVGNQKPIEVVFSCDPDRSIGRAAVDALAVYGEGGKVGMVSKMSCFSDPKSDVDLVQDSGHAFLTRVKWFL